MCDGEAVVELLVDVSLDGGDLFLLGGLKAKGCSKRFELEQTDTDTDTHTSAPHVMVPCSMGTKDVHTHSMFCDMSQTSVIEIHVATATRFEDVLPVVQTFTRVDRKQDLVALALQPSQIQAILAPPPPPPSRASQPKSSADQVLEKILDAHRLLSETRGKTNRFRLGTGGSRGSLMEGCARLNGGHLTRCRAHTTDVCAPPMSPNSYARCEVNLKTALSSPY